MRKSLLAAALLLASCGTAMAPDTAPGATTTRDPTRPVPWIALPATSPTLPTVTIAASPDPAPAAQAPRCDADQVRISGMKEGVGAGTFGLSLVLTAEGNVRCRVSGIPQVTADDSGTPSFIAASSDDTSYDGPVLVTRDTPATLWLTWPTVPDCSTPVTNREVRVEVGNGTVSETGFGGMPACYAEGVDPGVTVLVHPWAPSAWNPEETITSVDSLRIDMNRELTAAPGATLEFEVTLTADTSLVLDPCPDYRIAKYGEQVDEVETWALNCAAIPYRTGDDRPYLPEGTPVRFAMQTTAPQRDAAKFLWSLVGSHLAAGGVLRVR